MSRFTKQITSYWQQFRTVVRNEYGSIFTGFSCWCSPC